MEDGCWWVEGSEVLWRLRYSRYQRAAGWDSSQPLLVDIWWRGRGEDCPRPGDYPALPASPGQSYLTTQIQREDWRPHLMRRNTRYSEAHSIGSCQILSEDTDCLPTSHSSFQLVSINRFLAADNNSSKSSWYVHSFKRIKILWYYSHLKDFYATLLRSRVGPVTFLTSVQRLSSPADGHQSRPGLSRSQDLHSSQFAISKVLIFVENNSKCQYLVKLGLGEESCRITITSFPAIAV